MKFIKIILITSLSLLLIACSSSANGNEIDKTLFKDGENLVKEFYKNAEELSVIEMNDELDSEVDKFTAKYSATSDKWSDEESAFIVDVSEVYISYIEYHLEKDSEVLSEFYDNVENAKKEYGFKF